MSRNIKGSPPRNGEGGACSNRPALLIKANSSNNPTRLTPALQSALVRVLHDYQGNGTCRQRVRLLAGLHLAPLTTLQLREHLDILHPAMRVKELRDDGHEIETVRVLQDTEHDKHRVAKYALIVKLDDCGGVKP